MATVLPHSDEPNNRALNGGNNAIQELNANNKDAGPAEIVVKEAKNARTIIDVAKMADEWVRNNVNPADAAPLLGNEDDDEHDTSSVPEAGVILHTVDPPFIPTEVPPYTPTPEPRFTSLDDDKEMPVLVFDGGVWPPTDVDASFFEQEPHVSSWERQVQGMDRHEKLLAALDVGVRLRKANKINVLDKDGKKTGKKVPFWLHDLEKEDPGEAVKAILDKQLPAQAEMPSEESPEAVALKEGKRDKPSLIPYLSYHPMVYLDLLGGARGFHRATDVHLEQLINQIDVQQVNVPADMDAARQVVAVRAEWRKVVLRSWNPMTWFARPSNTVWELQGFDEAEMTRSYYWHHIWWPENGRMVMFLLLVGALIASLFGLTAGICPANSYFTQKSDCAGVVIVSIFAVGTSLSIACAIFTRSMAYRRAVHTLLLMRERRGIEELIRIIMEWRRFAEFCEDHPITTQFIPPYTGTPPSIVDAIVNLSASRRCLATGITIGHIRRELLAMPRPFDPARMPAANDPAATSRTYVRFSDTTRGVLRSISETRRRVLNLEQDMGVEDSMNHFEPRPIGQGDVMPWVGQEVSGVHPSPEEVQYRADRAVEIAQREANEQRPATPEDAGQVTGPSSSEGVVTVESAVKTEQPESPEASTSQEKPKSPTQEVTVKQEPISPDAAASTSKPMSPTEEATTPSKPTSPSSSTEKSTESEGSPSPYVAIGEEEEAGRGGEAAAASGGDRTLEEDSFASVNTFEEAESSDGSSDEDSDTEEGEGE